MTTNEAAAPGDGTTGSLPFDTSKAHQARAYNYMLGGKDNYAADRAAADAITEQFPEVAAIARANRAFLGRAVRFAARQGITQFLDLGSGLPVTPNVHEIAQSVQPGARVVYVDHDPIVLAHAHKLLTSTPEGACAYIYGDLRDPEAILRKAEETLDFGRPTAVVLFGILHFFADSQHPGAIVARLAEELAPGSYLAVSHLASDVHRDALTETFDRLNGQMSESVILRSQAEIAGFFDAMDLVDPGVVQLPQWRPDPGQGAVQQGRQLPMWCAVGRKR